ncbi:unnamed protein product [Miscanthus lutarioriparius]|uniref:Uncharacterized protein n=1 Tax=Miscanthus lutarioriparius TaxID=422564 RepID=A0A811SQT3_9POAL|nr:unnamed protein product [Miscanthus lutarioriparius]
MAAANPKPKPTPMPPPAAPTVAAQNPKAAASRASSSSSSAADPNSNPNKRTNPGNAAAAAAAAPAPTDPTPSVNGEASRSPLIPAQHPHPHPHPQQHAPPGASPLLPPPLPSRPLLTVAAVEAVVSAIPPPPRYGLEDLDRRTVALSDGTRKWEDQANGGVPGESSGRKLQQKSEARAAKQVKVEETGVDPKVLKTAFLKMVKLINENEADKKNYRANGKLSQLKCPAYGYE